MTRFAHLAVVAAAMLAAGAPATAGTSPVNQPSADGAKPQRATAKADRELLADLARSGHAETAASRLALQKSQNAEVKALAQRIIDDHAKADARLRSLAVAKQVKLPDGPSAAKRAKLKLLQAASPRTFDGAYLEHFGVVMHEEALDALRTRMAETADPEVKVLASQLVPVLESHLNAAHELRARIDPNAQHSKRP